MMKEAKPFVQGYVYAQRVECEEPCEGRLSRTVLWEGEGETPSLYSTYDSQADSYKKRKISGMTFVFYFDWLIIRDFYVNLQQLKRTYKYRITSIRKWKDNKYEKSNLFNAVLLRALSVCPGDGQL